jgi:hypothetical protein
MKTLLTLLFLCIPTFGQQAVSFKFEHEDQLVSRLYLNGGATLLKEFTLSQVAISTNTLTGTPVYTYTVTATIPRGQQTISARVVADGVESDDSNFVVVKIKPKAPLNLRAL